jgi:hypothetical protein
MLFLLIIHKKGNIDTVFLYVVESDILYRCTQAARRPPAPWSRA